MTTLDLLRRGSTLDAEVQVFRLHPDVAIVLLPGEVFADLGLAIKRRSPFKHTLVDRAQQRQSGLHPHGEGVQGRQLRDRQFADRTRRRGAAGGDRDSVVERHRGKVASP